MQDKIILKTSRKIKKKIMPSRRQKNGTDSLLSKKVKTDFVFKQNVFKQKLCLLVCLVSGQLKQFIIKN